MSPDVVRVFSVDLDQPASAIERLDDLLPSEERHAPPSIRVARATLRTVLAETVGVDPGAVAISRRCEHCGHPTHGRPTLAGDDRISFSLSHSGSFGVIALAEGGARVGVDVEAVRPRSRLDALAARVLTDEERAGWLALDSDDARLRSFLESWTAKEAYLKALGIGIATRLRDVPTRVEGWTTRALALGAGRIGALAIDRTTFDVRYVDAAPSTTSSGGTAG